MDWRDWIGKRVFIKLKDGNVYSNSLVISVDISNPPLVFIELKDKFQNKVMVISSEIIRIQEDKR